MSTNEVKETNKEVESVKKKSFFGCRMRVFSAVFFVYLALNFLQSNLDDFFLIFEFLGICTIMYCEYKTQMAKQQSTVKNIAYLFAAFIISSLIVGIAIILAGSVYQGIMGV